ncbi:unnamed protein product, partial [Pylaiella littoralis]
MYITSMGARRRATPQVKRRYGFGCPEGLCRPVASFEAKDGGSRVATNGGRSWSISPERELCFQKTHLKCTEEFRELNGNEQQEELLCERAVGWRRPKATPAVKKRYESMVLVMWPWATPTTTWTQTRRTCLGRHHHH